MGIQGQDIRDLMNSMDFFVISTALRVSSRLGM